MDYTLDNETLQKLIGHLYANEQKTILQFRYHKPQARTDDIRRCNQAYQQATKLLKEEKKARAYQTEDQGLQQNMWAFIRSCVRFGYEAVPNFQLRLQFIEKLEEFYNEENMLMQAMDQAVLNIDMRKVLQSYVNRMKAIFNEWKYATSSFFSKIMRWNLKSFDQELQILINQKIRAKELIRALNFQDYDFPTQANLLRQTYRDILYKSKNIVKFNERLLSGMDIFTVFILGVMLWTIIESQTPVVETIKDSLSLGAAIASGAVGLVGGVKLGATWGTWGEIIGGVLGGIICSFVSGLAIDNLFDAVVAAFEYPIPPELKAELFGQPILYELKLPDNMALSRSFVELYLKKT